MRHPLLLSVLFVLSACGTSPEPSYFSLAAQDGMTLDDVKAAIKVQRPLMPDYLDRPDFIYQESDYHLSIDESSNWAEPLDKMFARILAADLQQRLPQSTVWSGNDDVAAPRYIVALTVQTFNPVAHGSLTLQGTAILTDRKTGQVLRSKPFRLTTSASGSARSVAAGLSLLIAQEADDLMQDIRQVALIDAERATN